MNISFQRLRFVILIPLQCSLILSQIGIKKMIHLIWTKDNNSTNEDGNELKGIRSRLIECYRSLYFDPLPDMVPKQQVNRIAKNMIQYVSRCVAYHYLQPSSQTHIRCDIGGADFVGRADSCNDG